MTRPTATAEMAPGLVKSGKTRTHKARKRRRAMAARQALSLCEAELAGPNPDGAGMHTRAGDRHGQHITVLTARTALRAAGLPPDLAAALRSRLRLAPDAEARP